MNTKTALAIFSMVALLTAVVASSVVSTAFAQQTESKKGGPKAQNNFGDCKDDFKEAKCKDLFTGSDR
jgi:hypothetical protein